MLCFSVSSNFFNSPIFKPNPQFFQGTQWRIADVRRQRNEKSRAGLRFFSVYCWNRDLITSRGCSGVTAPAKYALNFVSDHHNVDLGGEILISGFWVGPDIEDGWGYVEAYVSQLP